MPCDRLVAGDALENVAPLSVELRFLEVESRCAGLRGLVAHSPSLAESNEASPPKVKDA